MIKVMMMLARVMTMMAVLSGGYYLLEQHNKDEDLDDDPGADNAVDIDDMR